MLVGQNGSGKTNALMVAVISRLAAGHSVHIVDTKNELSQIFENHCDVYTAADVPDLIEGMTKLAQDRMQLFSDTGRALKRPIRDIDEYNKHTGDNLPVVSIIVEELIIITDSMDPEQFNTLFVAGRSSGVYFICLAQVLNITVLPKKCSANFMTRVYLGAPDRMMMKSVFPGGVPKEISAQYGDKLGPSGNALLYTGNNGKYQFIKFPRISEETLMEFMQ